MSTETHAESTGPEVVGVDGAGESWVAVALVGERFARAEVFRELPALPRVFPRASVFAIDVPMLLPDDRSRGVDTMLRRRRGVVASTVFSTPPRQALTTADYEAAQAWCRARNLKGFSQQAWALREKILDAERLLAVRADVPVVEVHPEASFAAMNHHQPLRGSKRSWNGTMQRRALLAQHGIVLPEEFTGAVGGVAVDDLLDAAAAAWSALRYARGDGRYERLCVEGEPAFVVV